MNSRDFLPAAVAAVVYLLFDAELAYAWGPAVHATLGSEVLGQMAWLPAAVAAVVTRCARDFLYGNLAADMVFAKRWSRVKQFCHHWSTGFALLDRAETDRDRAFAYGYLAHLAADTVAHGKYVPRQIAVTRSTVNFGHVYWEMRADAALGPTAWKRVDQIMAADNRGHHATLAEVLTETFLPFGANRQLFVGIHRLVSHRNWQRSLRAWQRRSRHHLPAKLLQGYLDESRERILCLLTLQRQSPVLFEDPNGTAALTYIRAHRRQLRRMRRLGLPHADRIHEAAASHAPASWQTPALQTAPS
jgi:hypothetical protein